MKHKRQILQPSVKRKTKYPGAEIIQNACYEDYKRCLDTYDKIYDKINIALVFCGVVLLVVMSSFDYTVIMKLIATTSKLEFFSLLLYTACSVGSAICIVWAVIKLLLMMRSQSVIVFDSIACRNDNIYKFLPDEAAVWLIDKYTIATNELKSINDKKNREYNTVIIKIVVAILLYAVVVVLSKGVQ